jgi:hypothetical protein
MLEISGRGDGAVHKMLRSYWNTPRMIHGTVQVVLVMYDEYDVVSRDACLLESY